MTPMHSCNPAFYEFEEDCRRISDYYFHGRYPGRMAMEFSREEIRKSIETADKLIEKIKEIVESKKGVENFLTILRLKTKNLKISDRRFL